MADNLKHKFTSPKADGPDTTLVRPSDWNAEHTFAGGATDKQLMWDGTASDKVKWEYPFRHFDNLLNNSGGSVAVGDVLVVESTVDQSVTSSTTPQDLRPVRIAAEAINNGLTGRFEFVGRVAVVNVQNLVARGDFLGVSSTSKKAGTLGATAVDGAFGRAITGFAGPGAGSVVAVLFGSTLQVKSTTTYDARGLRVTWSTNSILDVVFSALALRDNNDRAYIKNNPSAKQCNITTTGPGGRDQSGTFSNNSFFRLYAIIKADGTHDVVASVSAPPTGPDLLTLATLQSYVGWAYLSTWRIDASGALMQGRQEGDILHLEASGIQQVLAAGNSTTEVAINLSNVVPAEAIGVELEISALATAVSQANALRIRSLSNVDLKNYKTQAAAPNTINDHLWIPNRGQQFFYLRQTALATDFWVTAYRLPTSN